MSKVGQVNQGRVFFGGGGGKLFRNENTWNGFLAGSLQPALNPESTEW